MRNHLHSLQILLLVLASTLLGFTKVKAQDYPENVDLGVELVVELPPDIKINGAFAVQAEVFLDANSSDIPNGETTLARIELLDPNGITIDSYQQVFNGFTSNSRIPLSNDARIPGKVLFQIPWSQAKNWNEGAEWRILIHVICTLGRYGPFGQYHCQKDFSDRCSRPCARRSRRDCCCGPYHRGNSVR